MFPGGSQVLSALGIFLEVSAVNGPAEMLTSLIHCEQAGIAVTKSFEDVAGLFAKIGESTRRMRLVSQEDIPPGMIPIYQAMLLTLLKICGLGIKITLRPEPSDEQVTCMGFLEMCSDVSADSTRPRRHHENTDFREQPEQHVQTSRSM
jgi:hypothetical protein